MRTASSGTPIAMAAAVAASTLETFTRDAPASVNGTSATSMTTVGSLPAAEDGDPAVDHRDRPSARLQRLVQVRVVGVGGVEPRPGSRHRPHRPDQRIVGVQHGPAVRLGDPDDDRFDLGELLDGVHAQQPEVIGADVRHHRDVVDRGSDPAQQDAAAGRFGDRDLHPLGSSSTRAAPPGPDQSPVSTSSPSMKMPSVDDHPGVRPPAFTRWAINRVVVVLPLVPVTAMTGMVGRNGRTVSPGSWPAIAAGTSPRAKTGSIPCAVIAANALATAAPNSSAVPRCRNG